MQLRDLEQRERHHHPAVVKMDFAVDNGTSKSRTSWSREVQQILKFPSSLEQRREES
jgi:hypothetical protein